MRRAHKANSQDGSGHEMPRSALLPPRPTVAGNAPEDLFEIYVQPVATSLRKAGIALRRAYLREPRQSVCQYQ